MWEEVLPCHHRKRARNRALAEGDTGGPPGPKGMLWQVFPFIMIAVLFYMLMIRPERRKRAEMTAHAAATSRRTTAS